ncbi:MAG: AAA family ATPase [Kangiella sp.]|nr:MAG: AAA family ATPase [Kangiella sp.]
MFKRKLKFVIKELLSEFRIVYLTGPRQAGKTTLVRQIADQLNMDYATLDTQAVRAAAENDPHGFIFSFSTNPLVLDEFQYIPELIPAIKAYSDQLEFNQKGKFLLTGSADIFRSAKTQEALPGHMARLELYPLSVSEITNQSINLVDYLIKGNFSKEREISTTKNEISQWLLNGGYPEIQSKSERGKLIWFKSYLEGRLLKDFESLYVARGDYYSKLKALIPYLAGLSGNLIKYSNVANDLELNDKLVRSYIEILELMFIVKRVPGYLKNTAKRGAVRMPKIHLVDTGLACHLLGLRTVEQIQFSQYYGGLLESLIFMEFQKHAQWSDNQSSFYHFRDKHKNEVDIVLEQTNGDIIGIEVKASASIKTQDFRGLKKLAEFSGKKFQRGILFYSGTDILPFHQDGNEFYALPIGLMA